METTIQEKIDCPICSSPARHLYKKTGFNIAQCLNCKTIFIENPPIDTSYIYDKSYFFGGERGGGYGSYDEEKEAMRATFEKCLDFILKYQTSGALFDVGAATGYFLALARNRGFNVSGIDISAAAVHEARKKGIEVKKGTLETVPHCPNSFDVITMFDVLEHVSLPDSLLRSAADLLKRGGILMGCTPDSMSVYARYMGKHWHMLFPPEHLVLLNDKSLRLLLNQQGFEVIWTGRIMKRFSLSYIFQTASRWLNVPFFNRIGFTLRGTWFGRIAVPLDLHDNIFFLARKKASSAVY